jgi:NAD(P)-dependent dehydrogenase (short-subunit alcohol dehydrogenase family)
LLGKRGARCAARFRYHRGRPHVRAIDVDDHPRIVPLPDPAAVSNADLSGRAILVTGASGGLGQALARACAMRGATVVLHGRVVRKLESVYDEIVSAGHPQPTILPLDLAKASRADFDNIAGALRSQLGRLDGIVHTAAFLGSLGPVEHQDPGAWRTAFEVNVTNALALTRAVLPLLATAPDASVVFTLDSRGVDPRAFWGAYAASKAALAALAMTLADEWETRANLRVNAVVPGPVRSPLRTRTHPGEEATSLPPIEALVPLYLHLIGAQEKTESGVLVDARAWLAGQPAARPLVSSSISSTSGLP